MRNIPEALPALPTPIFLLDNPVLPDMPVQVFLGEEVLSAHLALVIPNQRVSVNVLYQVGLVPKRLIAEHANVRLLATVYKHVLVQRHLCAQNLMTHFASCLFHLLVFHPLLFRRQLLCPVLEMA